MKLVVFGKTGQVATELAKIAPWASYIDRNMVDFSHPEAAANIVREMQPDAVINAVAYTDVETAESEEDLANLINAEAPAAIARVASSQAIPFVHISTDYVFDGSGKAARRTTDPTAPLNAYGRSKLKGEQAIMNAGGIFAILRTSWVFSGQGSNFMKTMLRLSAARDSLSIIDDQFGGPTPASSIAKALLTMAKKLIIDPKISGIFHLSGTPDVTWAEFAKVIFSLAGFETKIEKILTTGYPFRACRPLNSRLDCSLTASTFDIKRPDWRKELELIIRPSQR